MQNKQQVEPKESGENKIKEADQAVKAVEQKEDKKKGE